MSKLIIIGLIIMSVFNAHCTEYRYYINPVLDKALPDPTVLAAADGYYYVYATQQNESIPIYRSQDLIEWAYIGNVFKNNDFLKELDGGHMWAPDVIYRNGVYVMAYALSKPGEYHNNGIGIATSSSPTGPFISQGLLFTSDSSGVRNSIDPSLVEYNNRLYLLWGSFYGIFIAELKQNEAGEFFVETDTKIKIAGNAFEGTHVFKHGEFYYLFASVGSCCNGDMSTYRVVVGRSKNIFGPYIDSDGYGMLDNGYNLVFGGNEKFVGTGHGSKIIVDNEGKTWYIYHSYLRNKCDKGRLLMLDEIRWSNDGWPYLHKGSPSTDKYIIPSL